MRLGVLEEDVCRDTRSSICCGDNAIANKNKRQSDCDNLEYF